MSYVKQHKILSAIILIALAIGGYAWYQKTRSASGAVQYVTSPAATTTVVSTVTGTGQVESTDQVDIKPVADGQLVSVPVQLNQQVAKGQTLGIVDQTSAANTVAQAKASLQQAQANYDNLMAGATSNSIQAQQLAIQAAQLALDQAKQSFSNTKAAQQLAVNKALTSMLNDSLTATPSNNLSTASVTVSGNYSGTTQGSYTISTYESGSGQYYSSSGLGSGNAIIQRGIAQPIGNGLYISFGSTGTIDPSTTWTINLPNTQGSSYLNDLNAYNTAIQNQQQALQQAQNAIDNAQNALDKANNSYQTTIAPPTDASIASAKAQITSAQAQLDNAETSYQNTILTAPFNGTVAALDFKVGDKITAGTTFATIITNQQLAQVTLNEVDVAKVKLGQKATLTFDAVNGLQITGTVAEVDTIGTVSQGVVSYGVQIAMDTGDPRIKPGMSVSANIVTAVAPDALAVPSSAIKANPSGGSYVQILGPNGQPQNIAVTTGISDDTNTVITSGLTAGQQIITQTVTSGSTAGNTGSGNAARGGFGGFGGGARIITGGRGG